MNTILPRDPLNPAQSGTSSKSGSVSGPREVQASAARLQSLAVSVTTADGDSFVLNAEKVTAVASATYSASSSGGSAQLVAQSNTEASISASRVAVALSGELDADEAKDIARAVKELVKALRDTEKGHLAQAAHRTERLAKLDTIASATASALVSVAAEVKVTADGE